MSRIMIAMLMAPLLAPAGAAGETESRAFLSAGVRAVSIETETGSIEVAGVAKGDVQVRFLAVDRRNCRLTAEIKDGTLSVGAVRPVQSSRKNCPATVKILVPTGADIDALAGSGDIDISSVSGNVKTRTGEGKTSLRLLEGALTADAGTGDIKGTVASQDVRIQIGSGAVDLQGLRGSARVQVGRGNARLSWRLLPPSATVHVQVGEGNCELLFPPDARLHATFNPPGRPVQNEFADDGGAGVFVQDALGKVSLSKSAK